MVKKLGLRAILLMITLLFPLKVSPNFNEEPDIFEILVKWREDYMGNKFRSTKNTTLLVNMLCLEEKSLSEIVGLLGRPNKVIFDKGGKLSNISYFSQTSVTDKMELIDTTDYCYALFLSKESKSSFHYFCR